MALGNAWKLGLDSSGDINWHSESERRATQPTASLLQNIEDWFFAHVPIEGQL